MTPPDEPKQPCTDCKCRMVKTGDIREDETERACEKTGQDQADEAMKTSIKPDPRKP